MTRPHKSHPPSAYKIPDRLIANVFNRVEKRGAEECWPWKPKPAPDGYGHVSWTVDGHTPGTTAHRVAWIAVNGPIPVGLTVDHLCRNRVCCNPAHLRLLPNVVNARMNANWAKTHCKHGHEFTPENTICRPNGHRNCKACRDASNARRSMKAHDGSVR